MSGTSIDESMVKKIENSSEQIKLVLRNDNVSEIDEIIEKLTFYRDKLQENQERYDQKVSEIVSDLQAKIDSISDCIDEDFVEILDTVTIEVRHTPSKFGAKKFRREPKYKYTDDNGQEKTWAGTGRVPKVIQRALDQGVSLDNFLIEKPKAKAKYHYTDDNGDYKTWSGLGAKPAFIRKKLEEGETLESFLIDK